MSVSTDAILFFGYVWDEELNLFENHEDKEWDEILLSKRGFESPWDSFPIMPDEPAKQKWLKDNRSNLDIWHKQKEGIRSEFKVDIGNHCSSECQMPYLYVVETRILARRGYPEEVKPLLMRINPVWEVWLNQWISEFDIKPSDNIPKWWLVSNWS